jgi:plastocyanin
MSGPTRTALAVTALGTALLLSGCGGSSSSTAGSGSPSMSMSPGSHMSMSSGSHQATITIKNFAFSGPASVPAGSTVTVTNDDQETHSLTADGAGGFDVTVQPGSSKTFTAPGKAGAYPYHCNFHSDMHGTLTVR